jgi:hypothetical protein
VSTHYSEDDLTLYYYGEGRRRAHIEQHLQSCPSCTALLREISDTLSIVVADPVPERGEQYGLEVWQRIRHRLPEQESGFGWFGRFVGFVMADRMALAGAAALLVVAAFVAGRAWQSASSPAPTVASVASPANPSNSANPANPSNLANSGNRDRERILLTSVADHLERSERVLTDIMNAANPGDISVEQRWADDLLTTSRLYRQDAEDAGEQSVASVLDELERNLLEIVHSPSKISAADLDQLRRRIDAAALLFKVRVMGDELRQREAAPAGEPAPRTSTTKIS